MSRMNGVVKWYQASPKGYGFIAPDEGEKDIFLHHSVVKKAGVFDLQEGERVSFEIQETPRGLSAINMVLI